MNRSIGVSVFLLCVMAGSTLQAQFVRVGPFGGVRIRAPFFSMDVPGPPIPPPFFVAPVSPVVVPTYRYSVNRYPVYGYPQPRVQYNAPVNPQMQPQASRPNWTPPADMAELETQLRAAALRLVRSLSVQRDAEVWTNYLAPNRIVAAIEQGSRASLAQLIDHYDGVAANRQLAWLARLDGFSETRSLLHQYVGSPNATQTAQPEMTQPQAAAKQPQSVIEPTPADKPKPADKPQNEPSEDADAKPLVDQEAENAEPMPLPLPLPVPDPVPADRVKKNGPTPVIPIKSADRA